MASIGYTVFFVLLLFYLLLLIFLCAYLSIGLFLILQFFSLVVVFFSLDFNLVSLECVFQIKCQYRSSFYPTCRWIGTFRFHIQTIMYKRENKKQRNGPWMWMKMSATAYFLSYVIKSQFAVDCRFCSQNFCFYTNKYQAQVMSKLWLSKNRTQYSNEIVIFQLECKKKNTKKKKKKIKMTTAVHQQCDGWCDTFFLYLCLYRYMKHTMSPDLRLQRFIFLLFIPTAFVVCTFVCSSCLFNTSLFFAHIKPKEYICYNVWCLCVMYADFNGKHTFPD